MSLFVHLLIHQLILFYILLIAQTKALQLKRVEFFSQIILDPLMPNVPK